MKIALGIIVVIIIGAVGLVLLSPKDDMPATTIDETSTVNGEMESEAPAEVTSNSVSNYSIVTPGTYEVVASQSIVNWAGQKPLIDGYVNRGSIAVSSGDILVGQGLASGSFTVDMNTLSVSETPTKPGQESALEGHLKGERWFNVAEYPEATFKITQVTERADSGTTFMYDVTGELTMKGTTDTLTFPALIYQDANGVVHASADLEFDRTKWGITANSGAFFDNLADNVIDDMVSLSFKLVAQKQ